MKRSILLLLCALMAILCLAGCDLVDKILGGGEDPEEHVHTYASTLSSDATGHWYAATCECDDAGTKDFVAHVDLTGGLNGGKDGKCDTCAYVICAHTYATEWSNDATNHWHAVTCGCDVAVADKAAHTYTEDGCVCGYMQTLDLTEAVYNGTIAFSAADAVGFPGWWEYVVPVTFTVATPGTYSLVNDAYIAFYADEESVSDELSSPIYEVTTTEAGESVTVYAYNATYGATAADETVAFSLVSTAIDVTVVRGAAELNCGIYYTVNWTAPAAGTYYISDLETAVIWDDNGASEFFILNATEAGQEFSFTVIYYGEEDTYTLNWFIQPYTVEELTLGVEKELNAVLGAPVALTFTAPANGTYRLFSDNEATRYGVWFVTEWGRFMSWSYSNDEEITLLAGETFTFFVAVDEAIEDVTVTVTGTLEAELESLVVGTEKTLTFTDADAALDGAYYVVAATEAGWYKVVADGLYVLDDDYDYFDEFVYLQAGEIVIVNVYYYDDTVEYDPASSFTVSLAYSAEEPTPEVTYDTELYVNWYSNVLVEAGVSTEVTLTITSAGIYVISVETLNGQLADRTGTNIAIAGQNITVVVSEQDLTDFGGEMVIPYFVSTTDGLGGVVDIYVAKQAEEEEEEDYGDKLQDVTVEVTDTYSWIDFYTFTATEAGDYAFFVPAGLGFLSKGSYDSYAPAEVDYQLAANGGVVVVTLLAGDRYSYYVGAATKGNYTIEIWKNEASSNESDANDNPVSGATAIVVGSNTIVFSAAEISANSATLDFVATATTKYEFTSNNLFVASVKDSQGNAIPKLEYKYFELTAGETYTVEFGMFSNFGIKADTPYILNVIDTNAGGEDNDDDDEPAGNETALNIGANAIEQEDVTFKYTATEAGTLKLSAGNAIMGPVTITYTVNGGAAQTLALGAEVSLELVAGDVVVITVVAEGYSSIQATWTATAASGNTALNIGANAIEQEDVTFEYTAAEAGTLKLTAGAAIMGPVTITYTVNGGAAQTLALSASVELTLAVGDKVVITVVAEGYSSLSAEWTATGAGGDEPAGPAPVVVGNNTVNVTDADIENQVIITTFTVTEAGNYAFQSGDIMIQVVTNFGPQVVGNIYLEPGTYTVNLVTAYISEAGEDTFTVSVQAPSEEAGTQDNPIVLDEIPAELEFTGNFDKYYSYTATEAVTIVITKLPGSYMSISAEDYSTQYAPDYSNATYTIFAKAGETIVLNPWVDSYADDADSLVWTYTFTVSAPVLSGSEEKPVNISTYQPGSLDLPGADADGYKCFKYNAWIDGTLTLTFSAAVDVKYFNEAMIAPETVTGQTVVVINIAEGDVFSIRIKGESTVTFTAATAYKPGTQNNPLVLDAWQGNQSATANADEEVWYQFVGGAEGGYVTLTAAAGVTVKGGTSTYNLAEGDGSVRFYVKADQTAYAVISSSVAGEVAFALSFEAGEHELDGSSEYPFNGTLGDVTCAFPGGYSFVWYKVLISETGYLTVTSADDNAEFVISPSANAYAEGVKMGVGSVSYGTAAGVAYVGVWTVDSTAAEIAFTISFEAGELQADGSLSLPYAAVAGENTCAFPGGADLVWYAITVEETSTITVSSSVSSAWLVLTLVDQYDAIAKNTYDIGAAITAEVEAGTYFIGVADWDEFVIEIPFTVTVE